jgi:hypothetical protein
VPVSQADRDYFARIGAAKRRAREAARAEHEALSLDERLARSWRLMETFPADALERRDDDPRRFYDRARALGLYRG